ncbi:MAG: hypothetical protein QMC37_03790, partial [Flavobacteriales bacterium]
VYEAADAVINQATVNQIFTQISNTLNVGGFNRWARRLKRMNVFDPHLLYNRVLPNGLIQAVNSGLRMTPQLMNEEPGVGTFQANPEPTLRQLVIRAIHRHVNDLAFKTIDLVGNGANNPNAFSIGNNTLSKKQMSEQFIHNSQRAFWDHRVSQWAMAVGVPAARNAVQLTLIAPPQLI